MIFAAAAAISGRMAHWSFFRSAPLVASSRMYSRNSPTVRLWTELEGFLAEAVEDQAAYVILIGVDQRLAEDFAKGQIGEFALGGHPLAFRCSRDARQLVAGFLFVRLRKDFAEIGEMIGIGHGVRDQPAPVLQRSSLRLDTTRN